MTMPIDLVLVRHGESEGNVANRRSRKGDHSCFTDEFLNRHSSTWRLTPRGREQAKMAGEWIRKNIATRFDRYYVSDYVRALESAAFLGLPGRWYRDFYLRERDWGDMDVLPDTIRQEQFAEALRRREMDSFFWTPPNGESLAQLCLRIDRLLFTLHRECGEKRVIIVCHGEVMWAFRVRLERMSQERFRELENSDATKDRIHNAQVIHYTRRDPESGDIVPHVNWMRSVCTTDPSRSQNDWDTIRREWYTNEQLLEVAERIWPSVHAPIAAPEDDDSA